QRFEIVLRHARIRTVRHQRQSSTTVVGCPFGDSVSYLLIGPATKSRLFIRGKVGAVNRAERNGKGSSTSVRYPLWVTVASATGREGKNILTLGDQFFVVGLRLCRTG